MKKVFLAILISVLCFIPFSVNAEEKEYKTLNLDEALKEEEIDHDFSNYQETDDQAIIYLFRGKGCAYCKKFLTYLNSIVDDYGNKIGYTFKLNSMDGSKANITFTANK